ncbi:popeye domain-containing protein 3-like isoform X2 [Pectinophora gossypiella]|uniref:popeye domain-containing protein 3-like isoform X2 n=1 Tax=Pectinophora gossypiella TaxID=13191 RepID=UPI00214EFE8A|nr:popeye domain-containing protein 3-like isoform X2 [Pectinophora gossypiella]
MAHQGSLADVKHEFIEIGEYNFSWPGDNGTFGPVNYTLPSGPWYWPWCPLWRISQHPLFQLSNMLFVASYCAPSTKKGQLWMHTILIFGFMLYSVWAWHVICSPDAFSWNFGFVFLNLAQVVYLVYEMRPVKFDPELEEVYHTLFEPFKVSRLQFKRMVSPDFAHVMSLHAGEAYAMQNLTKTDRLGLLLAGKVNVMSGHQFLHPILPCEFLDSPEFESSRATIDEKFKVSIVAASSCRYVYWQRSSLEYLFVKEPYLACVVTTLIARDITTKLYAMNNKIVTERGSHLDIRLPSISHALARSPRRLRSAKLPPPTTVQPVPPEKRPTKCWTQQSEQQVPSALKRNGAAASYGGDEELMPLAAHEAPAASSDDLSVADSCPDTSSKYHSCEAVETDDELRH